MEEYYMKMSEENHTLKSSQSISQDRDNPKYIAYLNSVREKRKVHISEFIENVRHYKEYWLIRNPDHKQYNIFHYLSYCHIHTEMDANKLKNFFKELVANLKTQSELDLLYTKTDYSLVTSQNSLTSPNTPLQCAVLNGSYYYCYLIITHLLNCKLILSDITAFSDAISLNSSFIGKESEIGLRERFKENRKCVNYLIIDETLKQLNRFQESIHYDSIVKIIVDLVNQESVSSNIADLAFIYNEEEHLPLLHQMIRRAHVEHPVIVYKIFEGIYAHNLVKYNQDTIPTRKKHDTILTRKENDSPKDLGKSGDNVILYAAFHVSWDEDRTKDFFKLLFKKLPCGIKALENIISPSTIMDKLFYNPREASHGILDAIFTHFPKENTEKLIFSAGLQSHYLTLPFAKNGSYTLNSPKKSKYIYICKLLSRIITAFPRICEKEIQQNKTLLHIILENGFNTDDHKQYVYNELLLLVILHSDIDTYAWEIAKDKNINLEKYIRKSEKNKQQQSQAYYVEAKEYEKLKNELMSAKSEISSLQRKRGIPETGLAEEKTENKKHRIEIDELLTEKENLEQEVKTLIFSNTTLQDEMKVNSAETENLIKQIRAFKQQLSEKDLRIGALQEANTELKNHSVVLTDNIAILERKNFDLDSQVIKQKNQLEDELGYKEKELSGKNEKIINLEKEAIVHLQKIEILEQENFQNIQQVNELMRENDSLHVFFSSQAQQLEKITTTKRKFPQNSTSISRSSFFASHPQGFKDNDEASMDIVSPQINNLIEDKEEENDTQDQEASQYGEDTGASHLKKKSRGLSNNVSKERFSFVIPPYKFASVLFEDYQYKKLRNQSTVVLNNTTYIQTDTEFCGKVLEPERVHTTHGNLLKGLWGEESIFLFLKLKYSYKYGSEKNDMDQFEPQGSSYILKGFKHDSEGIKYKLQVTINFPNIAKFEMYKQASISDPKKGKYDIKVTKKILSHNPPLTWGKLFEKKKMIDVKATSESRKALAGITKNEWNAIQKHNDIYSIYRIYNTGEWNASLKIVDDLKTKIEKQEILESIKVIL